MSREIKFRAWHKKDNCMVDWGCMRQTAFNRDGASMMYDIFTGRSDCELMQYTGLKDKNGVEIYEEDIVSGVIYKDFSLHIGRIHYDFNGYRISTKEKSLPLDLAEKLTVIGNIYENPELI